MSPCISCAVFSVDESGHDKTWQQEWVNDVCPKCNKEFDPVGDRILVDDDNVVYHYDCFEGPKPRFEEEGNEKTTASTG